MKKQTPALTQPPVADKNGPPPEDRDEVSPGFAGPSATEPDTSTRPEIGADAVEAETNAGPAASGAGSGAGDDAAKPEEPVLLKTPPRGEGGGASPSDRNEGRGSRLPLVLSVLALLGAGLLGWQVYELRQVAKDTRQEVAQRLASGDGTIAEIRALNRQNQESIATLQGRFGALESQVAASEGQAAALESLYQEFSRSRSDRVLAEVEQAINIAAQQLQLAGNFEAALIALQGAEARLAVPDQGHMQDLRKALLKDIDELKAHPQVDVSGLALRLEIVLERVDSLPLAYTVELSETLADSDDAPEPVQADESDRLARALAYLRAFGTEVWSELRSMVRLERMDQSEPVLLAPAQSTYLRENVKIRLLTARLALLARDGRTYASDLGQAREWLERFFDVRDEQVRRVIAELAELEQTPVTLAPPSLGDTFAALRMVQARSSTNRTPARPDVGAGAPAPTDDSR